MTSQVGGVTPPTMGVAIVGCGQIVTHHLEAMATAGSGKLVVRALCDPSKKRRAVIQKLITSQYSKQLLPPDDYGYISHLESLNDLLSPAWNDFYTQKIDIVFIAVPHDLHEKLAVQVLQQSPKIVVMEKPLAPTREACDRLVQVSEELLQASQTTSENVTDTTVPLPSSMLMVAEQSPYWQEVALARTMIAQGTIGTVISAASYYYESMRDNVTSGSVDESGGLGWRGSLKRAGGGIAIDGGLHWIRPLREMLGRRIERVVAVVRRNLVPELQMEGESVGHALFQVEDDPAHGEPKGAGPLIATYSCNMLATAPMAHDTCPYFRITGTKGELIIHGNGLFRQEPGAGGLRLYDDANPKGHEMFPQDRMGGFFLGFAGLWQEIYRVATTRDYAAAHESVVRGADDVRVVLAMYQSSQTYLWETVDGENGLAHA